MATSTSWAQDVITCDLCDKPTQQFCNSCQVNLCDACVKKHRDEFKSLIHEVVPFLERKIQLVFPECREHSGQRYKGKELSIEIGGYTVILKQMSQPSLSTDVSRLTIGIGKLTDKVRVTATIPTTCKHLDGVACVGEAEAWIFGQNKTITRIDIHGTVKDTVTTTFQDWPNGISVTRGRELIYSDFHSKTVNIVRDGKSETLITAPKGWTPGSLSCTRSGDILDGLYPLFMSESNNGDVCVSDTTAYIVVVDKTGRVRFRYDGTPARRENPFGPAGIVTDGLSQIIVADISSACLHILDQNGQFIRCVDDCGLEIPLALSVDSAGRLWFVH
uniref:Uncharacterized protein LOC111117240 n=1 Tax=Crassostrea virginica TaxID=6565 RepID=A0A8B8C8E5_CRAVI|nr:uncharacterized protein LOC111117240 [Crassostrea virginica]